MNKYTVKMIIVTPTNIPSNGTIEIDLHRFVIADNLRKMLYKAINLERDFTRVKRLNVEIENN